MNEELELEFKLKTQLTKENDEAVKKLKEDLELELSVERQYINKLKTQLHQSKMESKWKTFIVSCFVLGTEYRGGGMD